MKNRAGRSTRREFLQTAGLAGAVALTGLGCDGRSGTETDNAGTPPESAGKTATDPTSALRINEALFRVRDDGVTLHWLADQPHEARVLVGRSEDKLAPHATRKVPGAGTCVIDGQQPGSEFVLKTQYRRDPQRDWQDGPVRRVRTRRPPGNAFKVAILADTHINATMGKPGAPQAARQVAAAVAADAPDFVVFIGDEASLIRDVYRGRRVTDADTRESWTLWRTLYADLLAAVPSCLVLGNHEGEAGYYQDYRPTNGAAPLYLQRTATIGRKQFVLNPLPTTNPEGGEDEGWRGDQDSAATGGASEGNCSPLENYYAWTWGDALFVVLDVHRYTNPGGGTPETPEQWTLGDAQMAWFERTLAASTARWKVVLGHHLVGGWPYDGAGTRRPTKYCYGRGGGRYARVGEQARVNDLMKAHGARFFLYGHDHVFAHQPADEIEFVCCGRPSYLNPEWFNRPVWPEAYGSYRQRDFLAALGYTRLTVAPDRLVLDYVRAAADPGGGENVDTPVGEVAYRAEFEADA